MTCVICKTGETRPGRTTTLFERGRAVVVIKDAPAEVCENCGEDYTDEATTERLFKMAEGAVSQVIRASLQRQPDDC